MNDSGPTKDKSKYFVYEKNTDKPVKVIFTEPIIKENDDYTFTIYQTNAQINIEVLDKEYALQHTKYGWRCISWHPHYLMTDWVKTKDQATLDGDNAIKTYYEKENNENILP